MVSLPEQIKQESIGKIIDTASKMLRDEINLVEGSYKIYRLRFALDNPDDNIFNTIIAVVSDTDHIPLDEDVRKRWNQDALKKLDKELEGYIADMKPSILSACKDILKLF